MGSLTTVKTFDCAVCSAVFKSQRSLDSHMCRLLLRLH